MSNNHYTLIVQVVIFPQEEGASTDEPENYLEEQIRITGTLDDLNSIVSTNATSQTIRQMAGRAVLAARHQEFSPE